MARRRTEPVKHTCPDIDRIIDTITRITREMDYCNTNEEIGALLDQLSDWKSDLAQIGVGKYCELEDLRSSNASLRDWGQEMYDDAERLEQERDELENECENLKETIKDLEP